MQNRLVRKGLVVGIIGLFILVCIPQNVCADGLPDLIVEDIVIRTGSFPREWDFNCIIRNVGTEIIYEYISLDVVIVQYFLGIIPIKIIDTLERGVTVTSGVAPNERTTIPIICDEFLPEFGWYVFKCEVNRDHSIEESNYGNNFYNEGFFRLFERWFGE